MKTTETITASFTHTTEDCDDEPKEHVHNNPSESTIIPPRLPPLTVPAYPSQVSTMSTTLNMPHPSGNVANKPLSPTFTQPRSVSDGNRKSYGYNLDVSFPVRLPNEEVQVCYGPTNEDTDNIHLDDTLVRAQLDVHDVYL